MALDGFSDREWGDSSENGYFWVISVDNDLHELWAMQDNTDYVLIMENSQGFITGIECTDFQVDQMEQEFNGTGNN